jgi:DNA-binding GntR family transcriptional regulator
MMASRVSYRTKTDLVADAIRSMIQSGELQPGTELHQRMVAELLGVSPTPVREAMRRLEAEGFVSIEPHRSAMVVVPDDSQYEGALILGALEGLGAEMAAKKVRPGDIDSLVELNQRLAEAGTVTEKLRLDREFHTRICEITGSPILLSQLNLLWRTMGDVPLLEGSVRSWAAQHQVIIDALAGGDCSEARDATHAHVLDGFRDLAPSES